MKTWDVFISHASEDKTEVALPLAEMLRTKGVKVWLDKSEIKVGDSLRDKIDDGLARSRFGIVILSHKFFEKHWTKKEVDGLASLEEDGHKVILPVWHNIEKPEVVERSPMLAGLMALRTIDGLQQVASHLLAVILEPGSGSPSAKFPPLARQLSNLVEAQASRETIWDFFHHHNSVVKLASHRIPYPDVLGLRSANRDDMGFACWRDDEVDAGITLVIPGPTFNPLFDEQKNPVQQMQASINSIIGLSNCIVAEMAKTRDGKILNANKIQSRIIAGRRAFMSTSDLLSHAELREYDVSLRTYDQLIELLGAF